MLVISPQRIERNCWRRKVVAGAWSAISAKFKPMSAPIAITIATLCGMISRLHSETPRP